MREIRRAVILLVLSALPAGLAAQTGTGQFNSNEGMAAIIEVGQDGRGKLVSVLDEPNDPTLVEQLWWASGKQTFQPATVEGQPVSTHIVMLFEKMDVYGAAQ